MATYYGEARYSTTGTGPYKYALAWFDFNPGPGTYVAIPGNGNTFVSTIPNIGVASIIVTNNGGSSLAASTTFGYTMNILYPNPTTKTILYTLGSSTNLVTSSISLVDFSGNPINEYYFVVADGEDPGNPGEYNQWVTNGGPWQQIYTQGGVSGWNTTTLYDSGLGAFPVAASLNATQITWTASQQTGTGSAYSFLVPILSITKIPSKNYAQIGDTITYSLVVANNSFNKTVSNITIYDTIPHNTTLVSNSINVNGTSTSLTEIQGITLQDLSPGKVATVSYTVTITTTPPSNRIANTAYLNCNYGTTPYSTESLMVLTTIPKLEYTANKSADITSANLGTTITYSIVITNTRTVDIVQPVIIDTLPHGLTFVNGSITGGTGSSPLSITLTTLAAGSVQTVTFKAILSTVPSPNPTTNSATLSYKYKLDPSGTVYTSATSQTSSAAVSYGSTNISSTKIASKNYAVLGDTISYTLVLQNTGMGIASNVLVYDTLPLQVTFIPSSMYINGVNQPTEVIATGVPLTIPNIGGYSTTTIVFDVLVSTLPVNGSITNNTYTAFTDTITNISVSKVSSNSTTTISMPILNALKLSNKTDSYFGDTISYTVLVANTGNKLATNVVFIDTIPGNIQLVPNSLKQDGVTISNPGSPAITITLPSNIPAYSATTITYEYLVLGVPNQNPLVNSANLKTTYIIDPSTTPNILGISATNSNSISTNISGAQLDILKLVDKSYATVDDTITYTIILANTGNVTAINTVLIDTIGNGLSFIQDSLTINQVAQIGVTPQVISIPNIPGISVTTITFKCKVII